MRPSLDEIVSFLCCPDDAAELAACSDAVRCTRCARNFHALPKNVLDLLPSRPFLIPFGGVVASYRAGYEREYGRRLEFPDNAKAWGAPESLPARWVRLRQRQTHEALEFLRDENSGPTATFCDLSAGAGYCTFEAAKAYSLVFHCELSVDALAYAAAKAERNHVENIVFVRADYFQPPFRNSIHHLTCLDTLIRGPWHESAVLASIRQVLSPRGAAVVDFHNWWHNPLRRLGLLRENFSGNKSYTRAELKKLLAASGISEFRTQGFIQEIDSSHASARLLSRLIPPTRLVVRLSEENTPPVPGRANRAQESRA